MKKKISLLLSIALVLAFTVVLLATTALAEEKDITVSYMQSQDTTSDTTTLDTVAYESGKQTVKAGEKFTLPTTANSSYVGTEGYVLVWYTENGRTYKAGESVSFDKDTKLFRCVAKEVNNITDLNSAMTSNSNCAILTADIDCTTSISVLGQGQSILILNGFDITVTIKGNGMGTQRSGKHVYGEGTLNIINPNNKAGEYAVFNCKSHGYNGHANKTVVGRDVTINAPDHYLTTDDDGSCQNHYPWIRVYGTINVYALSRVSNSNNRSPFIEFFDGSNVTINGPYLYYDRTGSNPNYSYNTQGYDIRIYGGTFNLPKEAANVSFWTIDNEKTWTVLNDKGEVSQTHTVKETNDLNRDTIKIFGGSFTLADGSMPAIEEFLKNDFIGSIPSGGSGLHQNKDKSTYHVAYLSRPGYNLVFTTYSSSALGTLTVTDYVDGSLSGTYKYTAIATTLNSSAYVDSITVYEEDGVTVTDKFTLDYFGGTVAFSSAAMKADMKLQAQGDGYIAVPDGCEHDYSVTEVEATCSSVGYIQYTCKLCSHSTTTVTEEKGEHVYELVSSVKPVGTAFGSNTFKCSECNNTVIYSLSLDPKEIKVNAVIRGDDGELTDVSVLASDIFEFSTVGGLDSYIYTITGIKAFGEYSIRHIYAIEIPVGIPFINISKENKETYEKVNYGVEILSFADGVDVQVNNIGYLRSLKKIVIGSSCVEFTSNAAYKSNPRLPLTTIDMSKEGANVIFRSSSFESISTLTDLILGENSSYSFGSYSFRNCGINKLDISESSSFVFGEYAFENNKLTSLSFPDNMDLTFKSYCFQKCSLLENIKFGENADYVIENGAFHKTGISEIVLTKNSSYRIYYQAFISEKLTKFDTSASGITVILENNAFNPLVDKKPFCTVDFIMGEGNKYTFAKESFNNTTFDTFTLAANATYDIKEYAFNNNTALTTFDASATGLTVKFNGSALRNLTALTTLKLGEGSTYTFNGEWASNSGITSLDFSENSTYIFNDSAFKGMNIASVVLADNSTYTFNKWAFRDNSATTTLDLGADNAIVTFDSSVCENRSNLTTLLLNGQGSTYVLGSYSFKKTGVTEIVLGENSSYTFNTHCFSESKLTTVDASAKDITCIFNQNAFRDFKGLTTVLFGENGNHTFEYESFRGATNLKKLKFGNGSVCEFKHFPFHSSALEELDFGADGMTVNFTNNTFKDLKTLKVIKFGTNSTYSIGEHTFNNATSNDGANDIVFSATSSFTIGKEAFRNCDFSSIVFEDNASVTISGTNAFLDCDKATYMYLGKNFKITNYPFKGMKQMEKLVIMDGVTATHEYNFQNLGSADFSTPLVVYNHSSEFTFAKGTFDNCDGIVLYTVSDIGTRNDVFTNCQNGNGYVGFTVILGIPHKLAQGQRDPSCTLTGGTVWVAEDCGCGLVIDEAITVNVYENKHNITDATEYARQDVYAITPIPALGHVKGELVNIAYANGFNSKGIATHSCPVCQNSEGFYTEDVNAIFVCYGYSVCEFGSGMVQGYSIDNSAYSSYKAVNPSFSFGLVAAANGSKEAIKPLQIENGTVTATSDKVIVAPQGSIAHNYFEIKIRGFTSDAQKDAFIVFCLYTFDDEAINYVDNGVYGESVVGTSYNLIKG